LVDLIDVELSPSTRPSALTLATDLKPEQALGATTDSVVVRLDGSHGPDFVHELDETLLNDRAHDIVIHCFTTSPSE